MGAKGGRARRLLLVDDDSRVRAALFRILTALGYNVTEAVEGNDALAKMAAARERFDCIVSDVHMPLVDGLLFLRRLRARGDTTPVCFISGAIPLTAEMISDARTRFLSKPCTGSEISAAIQSLIDA